MKKAAVIYFFLTALSLLGATNTFAQCGAPLPNGKIFLTVPQGGSVVSRTSSHNCAEGQTCQFNVPGAAGFYDTFTANPDVGYKFVGWKNAGATSLCPGALGPCVVNLGPTWTTTNGTGHLEPIFEQLELLDLAPSNTRGAFRFYPDVPGAIDTTVTTSPSSMGLLPLLNKYSAGMDIVGTAEDVMLAQLDTPEEFLLMANLSTSDVATLAASVSHTAIANYQGYPRWAITGTGLEFSEINSHTLVIGSPTALEQALDASVGAADNIKLGPLSGYLGALEVGPAWPNSFVYGLPALYGAVPAPGNGSASLSQAKAVNSVFSVTGGTLAGPLNFFSTNAASYRTKFLQQLSGYPVPTTYAAGNIFSVILDGSTEEDVRPLLKTLFLDMDNVDYAATVTHGGNAPWLNFKVGENPNSIFINFEFKGQAERDAFAAAHLPDGFTLAPISILDGETPLYYLVLNIYQSGGGLVSGARAEWSVFVNDPDTPEIPRFLVIQAAADQITADSVHLLVLTPEKITHKLTPTLAPTAISSCYGVDDCTNPLTPPVFYSTIAWPQAPENLMFFDRQFVASNDYIFWGNGVADRGLYNSSVFNRHGVMVDTDPITGTQFSFIDNTPWKSFVKASPLHALVYRNPLEIVISPWWNLSESYLDAILDPLLNPSANPTRQALINFKNGFYPGLVQGNAQNAIRGTGLALSSTTIAASVPTASYHFPLTDANGLLTDIAGPGTGITHTPLAVALFEGEAAGLYVTLTVYGRENDTCGARAEWVTYVEGADGRPETLRLDAFASDVCLDPVSLMTVATNVSQSHNVVMNEVLTEIRSPFTRFKASVDLGSIDTDEAQAGLDWLESGDRVCSANNVCDEFYIDGQLLVETAKRAASAAVVIDETVEPMATPWDSYIDKHSVRAGVRLTPAIQAMNPWRNLRSFAAEAPAP